MEVEGNNQVADMAYGPSSCDDSNGYQPWYEIFIRSFKEQGCSDVRRKPGRKIDSFILRNLNAGGVFSYLERKEQGEP